MIRERITADNPAMRKAYLKLLVSNVTVTDEEIAIAGSQAALERSLAHGEHAGMPVVPSFDREWCRLQDSNL